MRREPVLIGKVLSQRCDGTEAADAKRDTVLPSHQDRGSTHHCICIRQRSFKCAKLNLAQGNTAEGGLKFVETTLSGARSGMATRV